MIWLNRLAWYGVVKPLSLLPLPVLYLLSNILYFVLYHIVGFRKKVAWDNLCKCFPYKTEAERKRILQRFYRHFCDMLVESIRLFSMPIDELDRRCSLRNLDILQTHYDNGKSIILVAGHYNNWELVIIPFSKHVPHTAVGIYTPLTNPYFERKMRASRGKTGMVLLPKQQVAEFFEAHQHELCVYLMGADQSPTYSKKVYWTEFLGRETAVAFGTEKYAREYDYPVVFGHVRKLRRGYYEMWFENVETQPRQAPHGAITKAHTRILEKDILEAPEYWLWTHKRWKRQRQPGE